MKYVLLLLLNCITYCLCRDPRTDPSQRVRCCYSSWAGWEFSKPEDQMGNNWLIHWNAEVYPVDPDSFKEEDVDRLSSRSCGPGNYHCMQYLRFDANKTLIAYRGFAQVGFKTCDTMGHTLYCYECDSDLCNNSNMWRPRERLFSSYDEYLKDTMTSHAPPSCPPSQLLLVVVVILVLSLASRVNVME